MQTNSVTDGNGVERCQNVIETAIENVKNQPEKGYHQAKAYCNQPMTLSVAQKRKICPRCHKEPVVGWPEPRVTNAAGVVLTPKELEQCGVKDGQDPSLRAAKTKPMEATLAVEAKVSESKKDEVVLKIPLSELEVSGDVAASLVRKVIEAFGSLPTSNYAESKRIMKLEEKLEALLRA